MTVIAFFVHDPSPCEVLWLKAARTRKIDEDFVESLTILPDGWLVACLSLSNFDELQQLENMHKSGSRLQHSLEISFQIQNQITIIIHLTFIYPFNCFKWLDSTRGARSSQEEYKQEP